MKLSPRPVQMVSQQDTCVGSFGFAKATMHRQSDSIKSASNLGTPTPTARRKRHSSEFQAESDSAQSSQDIPSEHDRSKQGVHFSSKSCEWSTPDEFFRMLDAEFRFDLDVCATPLNAKCRRFFSREQDGLSQAWNGTCWCNPPYGREIKFWIEKACRDAQDGCCTVVCLIPARTDTKWWHEFVSQASEVRFVRGRLKFGGHRNSAPFPSAVVVFRAS